MKRQWSLGGMTAILFFCGLGCGGGSQPEVSSVTGTVTLDGEPVEGAGLEFIPQPGASVQRIAYGCTDADGHYEAIFSSSQNGVPTGPCKVGITTSDHATWKGKEYSGKELFPNKYHKNYKVIEVLASGDNVFDFACESKGETTVDPNDDIEEGL